MFLESKRQNFALIITMNMKNTFVLSALFFGAFIFAAGSSAAQTSKVNTETSTITWEGGKLVGGTHNGGISLTEGYLTLRADQIAAGQFTIDMASMTNADLPADVGANLMGHLMSDDFFSVETYPTAQLVIERASAFKQNKASVSGQMTIKGKTQPVTFEVERAGNAYEATIVIDRSKFDVRYGSDSFFDNLGDNVILDEFTVNIHLELL